MRPAPHPATVLAVAALTASSATAQEKTDYAARIEGETVLSGRPELSDTAAPGGVSGAAFQWVPLFPGPRGRGLAPTAYARRARDAAADEGADAPPAESLSVTTVWDETILPDGATTWLPNTVTFHFAAVVSQAPAPGRGEVGLGYLTASGSASAEAKPRASRAAAGGEAVGGEAVGGEAVGGEAAGGEAAGGEGTGADDSSSSGGRSGGGSPGASTGGQKGAAKAPFPEAMALRAVLAAVCAVALVRLVLG